MTTIFFRPSLATKFIRNSVFTSTDPPHGWFTGSPEKHRPPFSPILGFNMVIFGGFLLGLGGGFKKFSFPDTQRGLVYLPTFGVIAPYSTLSIWVCVSLCIKKRYDVTHGLLTGLKAAPFEIRHGSGCRSFFLRRW